MNCYFVAQVNKLMPVTEICWGATNDEDYTEVIRFPLQT